LTGRGECSQPGSKVGLLPTGEGRGTAEQVRWRGQGQGWKVGIRVEFVAVVVFVFVFVDFAQAYVLLGAVGVPRRCLRGVRGRGRGPEVHRQGVDVL
jgi:hypothetical protein